MRTLLLSLTAFTLTLFSCQPPTVKTGAPSFAPTPLDQYVLEKDSLFQFEVMDTIPGEGHTTFVVRMVSGNWLSKAEVKNPEWWHWLTVVVPDSVQSETGFLFIGGGSRDREQPSDANDLITQTALLSHTIVADLHNVPNQPVEFVGDTFGPRYEDELIAYGWRQFLEGGAKEEDARWLARMPMTTAAVRAMDVMQALGERLEQTQGVENFVVAGGSKRGWTTWTTAAVDERVVGIVPIVIDLLNVIPSFEHHWRVYGFWAPAVNDYVYEGVMDWQNTPEYQQLVDWTEPYSYRQRLTMPKLLINATGDQFFIPDSWRFYRDSLRGESHFRYVPNTDHSLRESDAMQTLIAFHEMLVEEVARPNYDWEVVDGKIQVQVQDQTQIQSLKLWQAHNPEKRDFRLETIGPAWTAEEITLNESGSYEVSIPEPDNGFSAFFVELTFAGASDLPLKLTTGVVVRPDVYPFEPYVSKK
jgi:PhoPQ-activated pathogenicity-related protein